MSSHLDDHSAEQRIDEPGFGVHISPTSLYLTILGALIFLTAVTVWISFKDLGWANDIVALGIAFSKATLVVLFFMHVKYSNRIIKLVLVSAIAWMFVMLALTYTDYGFRNEVQPKLKRVESEYQDLIDRGYGSTATVDHGEEAEAGH